MAGAAWALAAAAGALAGSSAWVLTGAVGLGAAGARARRAADGVGCGRGTGVLAPAGAVGRALGRLSSAIGSLAPVERARRAQEHARTRTSCLLDLPVMIDVVCLGLLAGLSFDASLELYCERHATALAKALSRALWRWRLGVGTREAELSALADELGVAALGRFAQVVSEALAFGTPLAEALEDQAQLVRSEQRAEVEEGIERVPVKMLIPLGTLIVPAMFLAILGPLLGSALVVG